MLTRSIGFALITTVLVAASLPAQGATVVRKRPVQLALVTPVQIFPDRDAIYGVRLNLIYGRNFTVHGLDLGLVNHTTGGTFKGVQLGIVGYAERNFMGWQNNWVNVVNERFEGFQQGIVNVAESAGGFQLGVVNTSQSMNGLQLSLVNYARRLHGVQIGLINIIKEGGAFPVFPIVNWSFED